VTVKLDPVPVLVPDELAVSLCVVLSTTVVGTTVPVSVGTFDDVNELSTVKGSPYVEDDAATRVSVEV
jgi:hypothetical protein